MERKLLPLLRRPLIMMGAASVLLGIGTPDVLPANAAPSITRELPPNFTRPFDLVINQSEYDPDAITKDPQGREMREHSVLLSRKPVDANTHRSAGAIRAEVIHSNGTQLVTVSNANEALKAYNAKGEKVAFPNWIARAQVLPPETRTNLIAQDPLFRFQWGLERAAFTKAWDVAVQNNTKPVTIAVADCGIHPHPDLPLITDHYNFTTDQSPNTCSHGTEVTGVAAAIVNNEGIAGAVGTSRIQLVDLQIADAKGNSDFGKIIRALNAATTMSVDVFSLSIIASGKVYCTQEPLLQEAITYAWQGGIVIIAASGNEGLSKEGPPADCINVIAAGATDANDTRANFSNWGMHTVGAPGVSIFTTTAYQNSRNETIYGYVPGSGTSLAAPLVAGEAALLRGLGLSKEQIAIVIAQTADPIPGGYTRINAGKAVLAPKPEIIPTPTATLRPTQTPTTVPSATPTQLPTECSPRPPVQVDVIRQSPDRLGVTLTATTNPNSRQPNTVQEVRIGRSSGVRTITSGGTILDSGVPLTLPPEAQSVGLSIDHQPDQPVTVPLVVVDGCGSWPTFVGAGPKS